MHILSPLRILLLALCSGFGPKISAYLTLGSMKEITNLTAEARERIGGVGFGVGDGGFDGGGSVEGVDGGHGGRLQEVLVWDRNPVGERAEGGEQLQIVLGVDERGGEEVEDDVTASLNMVNKLILEYLNIPDPKSSTTPEPFSCSSVIRDYYSFLENTTLFLRAVEDMQITWRWRNDSPVFDSLGYLQALWASRRPNKQNRSFIEQQMALYSSTGCFSEKGNEVLRRDVEVVEYMNDLLDSFL